MVDRRAAVLAVGLAGLALVTWVVPAGADPPPLPPALEHYREAHEALARGEFLLARARFEALPPGFVLADYAAFFAAEAERRSGDDEGALARFRVIPDRFPGSRLAADALVAAMDTAFRLGRFPEAEQEARRLLALAPHHAEAGRVLVRLGEARAAQGFVAEAVADLRRRWIEAPASMWGEAARNLMETLATRHGVPVPALTGEERLLQAQRFTEATEFATAVAVLEGLLAQEPPAGLRHRALLRLAPALARILRGPEAVRLLEAAVADPPGPWQAALLQELARLLRRTGQAAAAVPVLERLLAEHPAAPGAPDAQLTLGRVRLELGQPAAARGAFEALVRAHPGSVAAAAAGWELGWLDYRAQHYPDAAVAFRRLAATAASYRVAGLYWAARALDAAGESGAATGLYRDVVSRAPHGYYGILARPRLHGPPPAAAALPLSLPEPPLARLEPEPAFQRGRALWRLGFDAHAVLEYETLGRNAVVELDRAFGLAVAFAEIGQAGRSLRYLRRSFGRAAEAGAPGLTEGFWRLLYPFGYAEVVRATAARAGLDPFFVAAVIREESSFDPQARSWVGAVGLMQLMPDTARTVAADAGVPAPEPARLWEPAVNIGLGGHYLAELRARFSEPLLAVASYNAGPHRVQQWRQAHPTRDLEEFVELIPFDETRGFVKRVATSWHHYRRLWGAAARLGSSPRGAPPRAGR